MNKAVPKNQLCPCGSGIRYQKCCLHKDLDIQNAKRILGTFSTDSKGKIIREMSALDSIPTHNKNGLSPLISKDQMIKLCLDEIYNLLAKEKVGMLADLVKRVVCNMNIIPLFTYSQIGEQMGKDERFSGYKMQVFSLCGTDPIELISENIASNKLKE